MARVLALGCCLRIHRVVQRDAPENGPQLEELLFGLEQRVTVIIVTHSMQQAVRVSDYTGFLCLGDLVEIDLNAQIFENPSNKLTQDYITGRFG